MNFILFLSFAGADPGFQVRGGAHKKNAPSGGRRDNVWGISCEKSRFYANKSYLFQLQREARKFLGYFVWKITILRQQIIFFPILRGRGGRRVRSPWICPWNEHFLSYVLLHSINCWWWLWCAICTRPTLLNGSFYCYLTKALKQQSTCKHPAPLGHIIQIPSQPVVPLTP